VQPQYPLLHWPKQQSRSVKQPPSRSWQQVGALHLPSQQSSSARQAPVFEKIGTQAQCQVESHELLQQSEGL
jgi:hypothetical protein